MNIARILLTGLLLLCTTSGFAESYAIHVIQTGDSLGLIANRYHVPLEVLMNYNELSDDLVRPGDVIKVPYAEATGGVSQRAPEPPPGFITHTLEQGETLSTLTAHYGVSLEAIVGANPDLSSLDLLPAGLEILIPPSEGLVITLEPDESIMQLMDTYDLSPYDIMKVNDIKSPQDIKAGMMIFLPGVKPEKALERLAKVREEENRYIWPVHGRITSYFGRRNLGMGTSSFHSAIDIAAPMGTKDVAARSGTVIYAGWSNQGYGNLIKIRHAGGSETWYAHHSKILVTVGQYVNQGETIGLVGSTGISTGPHVHFEIHENGKAIDPLTYLN